jgi:hypothetical protein
LAGEIAQIIVVFELPPKAFYKIRVKADSRYGIAIFLSFPTLCYANDYITRPNVCNDLFIKLAYFSLSLLSPTPVLDTRSLPARSTKFIKLDFFVILLINYK